MTRTFHLCRFPHQPIKPHATPGQLGTTLQTNGFGGFGTSGGSGRIFFDRKRWLATTTLARCAVGIGGTLRRAWWSIIATRIGGIGKCLSTPRICSAFAIIRVTRNINSEWSKGINSLLVEGVCRNVFLVELDAMDNRRLHRLGSDRRTRCTNDTNKEGCEGFPTVERILGQVDTGCRNQGHLGCDFVFRWVLVLGLWGAVNVD